MNAEEQLRAYLSNSPDVACLNTPGVKPGKPRRETAVTQPTVGESDIQRTIIHLLVMDGWLVIRANAGGMVQEDDNGKRRYVRFGTWQALGHEESDAGYSDLIASKNGRVLFVECKAPGKKQRDSQRVFERAVIDTGNEYVLADCIEAIRPYLERVEL
jgi:hypothetical protein